MRKIDRLATSTAIIAATILCLVTYAIGRDQVQIMYWSGSMADESPLEAVLDEHGAFEIQDVMGINIAVDNRLLGLSKIVNAEDLNGYRRQNTAIASDGDFVVADIKPIIRPL